MEKPKGDKLQRQTMMMGLMAPCAKCGIIRNMDFAIPVPLTCHEPQTLSGGASSKWPLPITTKQKEREPMFVPCSLPSCDVGCNKSGPRWP